MTSASQPLGRRGERPRRRFEIRPEAGAADRSNPAEASTVVVAERDSPTRMGIRLVLEEAGFSVVAEVGTAYAAVQASFRERPKLCLIAVNLPGAVEAIATMSVELPGTSVVALSATYDEEELFECVRVGALGYLLGDAPSSRMPNALRAVLRGEPALPRVVVGRLIEEVIDQGRHATVIVQERPTDDLTRRQREVLELMREGLNNAEIAQRLELSEVTVRRHLSNIVRRTGAADREALRTGAGGDAP